MIKLSHIFGIVGEAKHDLIITQTITALEREVPTKPHFQTIRPPIESAHPFPRAKAGVQAAAKAAQDAVMEF